VNVAAHRDEFIRKGIKSVQFVVQKSFAGCVHGKTSSITGLAD
jgi:hypothetical protein